MITFPNCKINLGLHILRKRNDGYHDLETIFYPLPFKEALEIVYHKGGLQFTSTGIAIPGEQENNLCIKAYHLLKKDFPELPPVHIHLHKAIPTGAGLGGGSADAAFTLKLLNDKFKLAISPEKLVSYALQLGSDCPFFLKNKPCFATSRGEVMQEIALDLSQYFFVLVNPGIHINTAWAFSNIVPTRSKEEAQRPRLQEAIQQPLSSWKKELTNDLEKPVFDLYPEIRSIKEKLYEAGALYAAMSGSGSTVFGIFEKAVDISFLTCEGENNRNYSIFPILPGTGK